MVRLQMRFRYTTPKIVFIVVVCLYYILVKTIHYSDYYTTDWTEIILEACYNFETNGP